jgi:general secretion pathway protein D
MELQGWTFIPEGKTVKVVKSKDAVKRMVPMLSPTSEAQLSGVSRMQTHLVALRHVKGEDIKSLISPLLSNDGTIQLNERTNLMVITEVSTNMARLLELIEKVDRPLTAQEEAVDSIELKHVAPNKMMDTVKEYFKTTTLRFLPDERLQVLVVTGRQQEVAKALKMVRHLDRPVRADQVENQILSIQYAKAPEVAALIEKLYKGRADAPPPTFSVNADKDSNSLILTGPPELRSEIAALIARIDIRYKQVMLKVLIGELNVTPEMTLGVQWSHLLGSLNSLTQDFGAIGRTDATTSAAGLKFNYIRPRDYSAFLQALETNTAFNVLASPQIMVSNNKPAMFKVGRKEPVQTGERISQGNDVVRSNEFVDVGLTLNATPSITPDGDVALDIDLQFSDNVGTSGISQNPIFSNREAKTSVIVKDEHTLIIAGLMRTDLNRTDNQVPVLGNLPVVGSLFRRRQQKNLKQELIVLITPTVIERPQQADVLTGNYKDEAFQQPMAEELRRKFDSTVHTIERHLVKQRPASPREFAPTATVCRGHDCKTPATHPCAGSRTGLSESTKARLAAVRARLEVSRACPGTAQRGLRPL